MKMLILRVSSIKNAKKNYFKSHLIATPKTYCEPNPNNQSNPKSHATPDTNLNLKPLSCPKPIC